ncbi:hypothetical protein CRE_30453 [Caenorhabditis remanei]|uniref:Uncharacterized protein n=1 Tax=Caenorhabditis remanei TaxID=31234 RepID=E3NE02_CAERE|nr:hypothetical protein CRE_30453 [Caenorhabditis remanei]
MGEICNVPKIDIDTVGVIDALMENDRLNEELAELILERERAIALYNAALDRLVHIQDDFENLQIDAVEDSENEVEDSENKDDDSENEIEVCDRQTQTIDSQEDNVIVQEDTTDDKEKNEE